MPFSLVRDRVRIKITVAQKLLEANAAGQGWRIVTRADKAAACLSRAELKSTFFDGMVFMIRFNLIIRQVFTLLVCYLYGALPDRFSEHLLTAVKGVLL